MSRKGAHVIITVGGIKGGTGKTTVATNLAVMRQKAGRDTLLIDADEQQSASIFAVQRQQIGHGTLPCVQLLGANLAVQIRDLAGRYEDVIIDPGGRDSASQRA